MTELAHPAESADLSRSPTARGAGFGPVLRNRNFMLIWLAQGFSQIAYHAVNFALVILVETTTHSSTAVSLIILSFSLPAVLFSALGGVLIDRSTKRTVMVVTTALRTLVLAGLIFVNPAWPLALLLGSLYLATFFFSTLSQFFGPAEGALIPKLVGRQQLIAANSLFNLTFFAAQLLGFAVVGPIVAKLLGLQPLFVVATGLYAVCTVLVWLLPKDTPPDHAFRQTSQLVAQVWADLVESVRGIMADRLMVKAIAYLSLASSAFYMLGTLGPAFVTRVLDVPATDLGFILAPAGIGIVLGLLLVTRLARATNRERMIDLGLTVAGAATLALALAKPAADALGLVGVAVPISLVIGAVMLLAGFLGGSTAFIIVPSQTVLQERSAEEMRARVYAAFYTVSNAVALGPVLFAGALSDLIGVTAVLILIGIGLAAAGLIGRRAQRA
jgi:MFS family permease